MKKKNRGGGEEEEEVVVGERSFCWGLLYLARGPKV